MYKPILITTTNSILGASVERYIELISVNVVIGTNFFSDLGASFTDLFGGLSGSYQKKLEGIYKSGIDKLKMKAMNIGANAIVGVRIDFDEISGKGKSMFMLSVTGTAVRLKYNEKTLKNESNNKFEMVSSATLEQEITKRLIQNELQRNELPSEKEWGYLLNYPIEELTEQLLDFYLKAKSSSSTNIYFKNQGVLIASFPNYLALLDRRPLEDLLYKRLVNNEVSIIKLLKSTDLFSPEKVIDLIKNDKPNLAIKCLQIQKGNYSHRDLKLMQEITVLFDNLKDLGKIEVIKGVLGKGKEKYICPKGHKNDLDVKYCQHAGNFTCGLNIKGLSQEEVRKINLFKIKVESLNSIFNSKI